MGLIINPYQVLPDDDGDGETYSPEDGESIRHALTLGEPELREMLARHVAENSVLTRPTETQRLLDRLVEACLAEQEHALGVAVLLLHAARVSGHIGLAMNLLFEFLIDLQQETDFLHRRVCRVCGCDDAHACDGGCEWVQFDLCSRCVGKEVAP